MNIALTLADLQNFDPQAPQRAGERRFLCPLCGGDKPKDAAHRCFCLNSSNGLYHCKRCNSRGRLKDFWDDKSDVKNRDVGAQNLRRTFEIGPTSHEVRAEVGAEVGAEEQKSDRDKTDWRALWESAEILERVGRHQAALRYLSNRGINFDVARENRVRLVPNWYGRQALGFPFQNARGEIVALSGRALRDGGLDKPAGGPKKQGAFWASALGFGAVDAGLPALTLCEAPFDALSLAMAGYPSLALGGTNAPIWLHQKCAFRRVLLAFDADAAGDVAALKIGEVLTSFGANCQRLRPKGAKDWNELLQKEGATAIEAIIAPVMNEL